MYVHVYALILLGKIISHYYFSQKEETAYTVSCAPRSLVVSRPTAGVYSLRFSHSVLQVLPLCNISPPPAGRFSPFVPSKGELVHVNRGRGTNLYT